MGRLTIVIVVTILTNLVSPGESCEGRVVLTDESGIIISGTKDYPKYARCEWLIDAQAPNKTIYLEFEQLKTECSYDFLFVFDGHSYEDKMLASFSGDSLPQPVIARSGKMLVYLFSDRNYQQEGFRARYSIQDCPLNCSNHGQCIDRQCLCFQGYSGQACHMELCPNDCGDHGACVETLEKSYCQCDKGYSGYMCNISLNDSHGTETWYTIAPQGMGFEARSAHAGALLPQSNCLYVFGGFTLDHVLDDLMRFCFDTNNWEKMNYSEPWPIGRYEHTIEQFDDGFYMFGGIMTNGTFSNELWYYNATSDEWKLCAENSTIYPIQVSGHSFTVVENDLYVFGGKSANGQFWDTMFKINGKDSQQWEQVIPLGGKSSKRRLVGHSVVYHKESKSLIIFGGYSYSVAQPRFGSHTKNLHMFNVENRVWSELKFDNHDLELFPKQRSFHSALIMGNYMVIYGGNTHIHHTEELCYDYEMYLYHLGCHSWVSRNNLMPKYSERRNLQGRVSHVALAAYGNMLVVIGGYSGAVMGDMMAFKFPPHIAPSIRDAKLDLDFCMNYTRPETCDLNMDCFFCHNITTTNQPGCMHRSQEKLCLTTVSKKRAECPGICGRLSTCLQCLSQGQGATLTDESPQFWTYIQPCNWCVKEASCQLRSRPQGTCSASTETVSTLIGWWNGVSASLNQIDQCRLEDIPAGLTEIKYHSRVNLSQPDAVSYIRHLNVSEHLYENYISKLNQDHIRWRGFIWPLNATVRNLVSNEVIYTLTLNTENIFSSVRLGRAGAVSTDVNDKVSDSSGDRPGKEFDKRLDGTQLFPNRSRASRYPVEILGFFNYTFSKDKDEKAGPSEYRLRLEWTGVSGPDSQLKTFHPFTYEFLEPFSSGDCGRHTNCLACMTDVLCGWCSPADVCVPRNTTSAAPECIDPGNQTSLLITEPSVCQECTDHVECLSCTEDPHCEWVKDYTVCVRRGRGEIVDVIMQQNSCPIRCHERTSCSSCLNKSSECAWCENLHTCLPFSDYVSRHRHGQCTEWIDNEVSNSNNPYTCRNCTALKTCDVCLKSFSCGWCGNKDNPTKGVCMDGDFKGPYGENATCSRLIHNFNNSIADTEPADWSYGVCPDVEECRLGLHNCTENAICTNTPTSFNCTCKRGYEGDGVESCKRTCYYDCVHGECLHDEDEDVFICDCDLGWTGPDCGTDCQCNFHSMCENRTGECDFCLNNTMGPFCNLCLIGHFGDPTKEEGCSKCDCNGHGDITRGVCHNKTGECFCIDNTVGYSCNACQDGYYGNPMEGGKCYLSCDHGMVIENITAGSVGSFNGPGVSTWRAYCLWMFTVHTDIERAKSLPSSGYSRPAAITFAMEDLAVECERDHVYVYDGIPNFIDRASNGVLLAAYCGFYTWEYQTVIATSGIITVYFDADIRGNFSSTRGFNASYRVNVCAPACDEFRNQVCYNNSCACLDGYTGYPNCTVPSCQPGCAYEEVSKSCHCEGKFDGSSYHINMFPWNTNAIPLDYRGTGPISRYGHVTISCDDGLMYLFGGRSLEYGLLNDIWHYNYQSHTWTELKPMTNERPSPRYFHSGACVSWMKNLFVFGGMVVSKDGQQEFVASKEMWKFAIDAKKWTGPIEPDWVVGLAGHSMTLVGRHKLFIIGGFSTAKYFSDTVYIYDANSYITAWETKRGENITGSRPAGIYGHSAIYNEASKTIYVYGGHIYDNNDLLQVSSSLYTYDVESFTWNMLQPEPNSQLEPRYFHQALDMSNMTTDYMLVIGGYTDNRNTSSNILIYKYKCNYWFTLDLSDTLAGVDITSLVSLQAVRYQSSIYVYGGFHNHAHGVLYQLTLPSDICNVHRSFDSCQTQRGCYHAVVKHNKENQTHCFTSGYSPTSLTSRAFHTTGPGSMCDENWHRQRECEKITSCSECVAVYPQFKSAEPSCFWCTNCLVGRCIPRGYVCEFTQQQQCLMVKMENITSASVNPRSECPVSPCRSASCDQCVGMGCIWSRHFQRNVESGRRSISNIPQYDWSCVPKQINDPLLTVMSPPLRCPRPCYEHRSCESCLSSQGGEGGSRACLWSTSLHECMPPVYVSLHCLGGECGTILQGDSTQKCPVPCAFHTKCAACRRAQGCGWCAAGGENGKGECMPGTMSGPLEPNMCNTGTNSGTSGKPNEKIQGVNVPRLDPSWAYATCPSENECLNGHHNCDPETQDCEDRETGFVCRCKFGYISKNTNGVETCQPVCHQGCTNGKCVRPDRCECLFGYVGTNCSTKCECNGHSNCESVLKKDVCLRCMNNTQGAHCEMCKPLYVGDPRNGGRCISCNEFCNRHTDICLHWTDAQEHNETIQNLTKLYPDTASFEFLTRYLEIIKVGPSNETNTYCINCKHNTAKRRCGECKLKHFRLHQMSRSEPCTKCLCNGHSDQCDRNSGLNCGCSNNTETRCNSVEGRTEINCHTVQCAECKEYFLGKPTKGHQCYRTMTVTKDYCFDPVTQLECTWSPRPLLYARSVFFVVQPRYVNVDIRVTIDVTVGGLDVYFSTREDTFMVDVNTTTGIHTVNLDPVVTEHSRIIRSADIYTRDRRSAVITAYNTDSWPSVTEVEAKDVNTFITVHSADKILIIRNVTDRLVITLPNDRLDLKTSRFYMVFEGIGDTERNETFGNMYFRQDQPHIDLFVFFSVFFSCFFLFLAMCVLLWKTKQGFDARRTRQQRAREMLHMASRPFAKVLALIEPPMSPYNLHSSPNLRSRTTRKPTDRTPLLPSETGVNMSPVVVSDNLTVSPIAIEPTDDGVAAVGTVIFRLPGGISAPSYLCLGSTLTKGYQLVHPATGKQRRPPPSSYC